MSEQSNTAQELGDFLRTRRAALTPAECGVPTERVLNTWPVERLLARPR